MCVTVSVGRQERKKLETRQRILESATRLFCTKGYEGTTVEEIAEDADVAKATFFKHFPRKYALIMEILEQRRVRLRAAFAEEEIARLPVKMQLAHYMAILSAENERDPEIAAIVLREYVRSGDVIVAESPIRDVFSRTIARAMDRGEVRPDVDPDVVTHLLWAHYLEAYMTWVRYEAQIQLGALLLKGLDVIVAGITPL